MSMRKRRKPSPIIIGNRNIYVRYPLQVTEEIQKKLQELGFLVPNVGQWIPVAILSRGGYQFIDSVTPSDSEVFCRKCCDIHNKYHGWRGIEIKRILQKSFSHAK